MNLRIVRTLISKDLALFFRNRFFALITILGIAAYLLIYFVMPGSVDESLEVGLYAPVLPPVFDQISEEEGVEVKVYESEADLIDAVTEGRCVAGVVVPADARHDLIIGEKPEIKLYVASDTPAEVRDSIEILIRELAYQMAGQPLAVEVSAEVLGPDMAGAQIPSRDRLRSVFAVVLVMTETFGLATLISEEVERRTIHGLLVTPATVGGFFLAKGTTGTGLAFSQAMLFLAIVGGMSQQPVIMLVAMLLGAVLVTGVAFLMAAGSKDMMSVMAWGVVAVVVLSVPAVSILLPGTISGWTKAIPSYYLVDTLHRVSNFGAGWGDVWSNLLILLGFDLAVVSLGIITLKRRFT